VILTGEPKDLLKELPLAVATFFVCEGKRFDEHVGRLLCDAQELLR
jgi:hypothetical protein